MCPVNCNWETEMMCGGGVDPRGCPMPDTCISNTGPMATDGTMCPSMCPVTCNWETEMMCGGGMDPNGCPMPDTCIPNTGPMGTDGTLPVHVPGHLPVVREIVPRRDGPLWLLDARHVCSAGHGMPGSDHRLIDIIFSF